VIFWGFSMLKILLAGTAAIALAAPATAATYLFELTGNYTATFQLQSSPTPTQVFPDSFSVANVSGTYQGVAGTKTPFFYIASIGGGFGLKNSNNNQFPLVSDGPQLFTGTVAAPTFKTGTFSLVQFNGAGRYALTITNLDAPAPTVPEPATWAMMIGGFGVIGAASRRRTRSTISYA
jgi:hypothetical protein